MKRFIRKETKTPKQTAEPYFDILNEWAKSSIKNKGPCRLTKEIKEGLAVWDHCDQSNCNPDCLFHRPQSWINITGAHDLCDLLYELLEIHGDYTELKERKPQDVFKPWNILPGCYGSNQ